MSQENVGVDVGVRQWYKRPMRGVRFVAVAAALAALGPFGVASGNAAKPTLPTPPTLSGESFHQDTPTITSMNCRGIVPLTFTYSATGRASGPYPGTFTVRGRVTGNEPESSSFTIDSPVGRVTGTGSIDNPGISCGGSCLGVLDCADNGGQFGCCGPQYRAVGPYNATITTPTGTFTDSVLRCRVLPVRRQSAQPLRPKLRVVAFRSKARCADHQEAVQARRLEAVRLREQAAMHSLRQAPSPRGLPRRARRDRAASVPREVRRGRAPRVRHAELRQAGDRRQLGGDPEVSRRAAGAALDRSSGRLQVASTPGSPRREVHHFGRVGHTPAQIAFSLRGQPEPVHAHPNRLEHRGCGLGVRQLDQTNGVERVADVGRRVSRRCRVLPPSVPGLPGSRRPAALRATW